MAGHTVTVFERDEKVGGLLRYGILNAINKQQPRQGIYTGENVYLGKDHTLHAKVDGVVRFTKKKNNRSYVSRKNKPINISQ